MLFCTYSKSAPLSVRNAWSLLAIPPRCLEESITSTTEGVGAWLCERNSLPHCCGVRESVPLTTTIKMLYSLPLEAPFACRLLALASCCVSSFLSPDARLSSAPLLSITGRFGSRDALNTGCACAVETPKPDTKSPVHSVIATTTAARVLWTRFLIRCSNIRLFSIYRYLYDMWERWKICCGTRRKNVKYSVVGASGICP